MSSADSDTDFAASEEDHDRSERLTEQPPSSVSTSCIPPGALQKTKSDCCAFMDHRCHRGHPKSSTVSLFKGCTRKRAHHTAVHIAREYTENELFSHKCLELQCYLSPLSAILRGLKSGRYSERLSSFQESVAMDRIQRIMGVLQNPHRGGRFLSILLKIEEMLQSWFPHVKAASADNSALTKKQKLCPVSPMWLCCFHEDDSSTSLRWLHPLPVCPSPSLTQDNAVSSSTEPHCVTARPLAFSIRSPCLERLLQAKESII